MRNRSRDGRKRQSVGHGEGRRKEERAIGFVLCQIKTGVGVDDLRDVVRLSEAVERGSRRDPGRSYQYVLVSFQGDIDSRHELAEPGISVV